jgi:tetratricopeptide (TPR) repeat protein
MPKVRGRVTTGVTTLSGAGDKPQPQGRAGWPVAVLGAILAAAAAAAYIRTFPVPLLYDDIPSIVDNPSLRHLGTAFLPPGDSTVGGRPVLNASLALNYAVSGTAPWSYHAGNLIIHALAGLVLFGIVRRTLAAHQAGSATIVAFCAALLWLLHPLLTESVTYVIQRAESLMGLLYLLTLYCLIRGAGAGGRAAHLWYGLSFASCLLGMGTKEVMVSAPLIAILYDRTFLAGSFAGALRRRRWVYLCMAATWLVLPFLEQSTHGRDGTAGFGHGVSAWGYALTQFTAIIHYLRLSFWPSPLVFDYGSNLAGPSVRVAGCALVVAGLVAATSWALVRRPALGFLGAAFFAILAPSSSFVPIVTETMAEHRMYLPLIPVVVLAVAAIHRWVGRAVLPVCLVLAAALFCATWRRNETYRSEEQVWSATAAAVPGNERAQNNLGNMLAKDPARLNEAVGRFKEALRLQPGYADAHYNLGLALNKIPGRRRDAIAEYEEALRLKPDNVEALNNLGNALVSIGSPREAVGPLEEALRLDPGHAEAHFNLGNALSALGRTPEAIEHYKETLRLRPDHLEAHFNLGNAFISQGAFADAVAAYQEALRLDPGYADAHYNLANAFNSLGRTREAVGEFEETLKLKPDFADAHYNLGIAFMNTGRIPDAIEQFNDVVRLQPGNADATRMLARIRRTPR